MKPLFGPWGKGRQPPTSWPVEGKRGVSVDDEGVGCTRESEVRTRKRKMVSSISMGVRAKRSRMGNRAGDDSSTGFRDR